MADWTIRIAQLPVASLGTRFNHNMIVVMDPSGRGGLGTYYDAVIQELPPAERTLKVVFFKWGSTGFLDAASYFWLVYDESGEIALPDEERSQAWKDRGYPEHRLVDEHCLTSTQRLSSHYYSMAMHGDGEGSDSQSR